MGVKFKPLPKVFSVVNLSGSFRMVDASPEKPTEVVVERGLAKELKRLRRHHSPKWRQVAGVVESLGKIGTCWKLSWFEAGHPEYEGFIAQHEKGLCVHGIRQTGPAKDTVYVLRISL